jgi:hypothetical protein
MAQAVRRNFAAGAPMTVVSEPCAGMWFLERGIVDVQVPHPYIIEKLPGPILKTGSVYGSHASGPDAFHGAWLTAISEVDLVEVPAAALAACRT